VAPILKRRIAWPEFRGSLKFVIAGLEITLLRSYFAFAQTGVALELTALRLTEFSLRVANPGTVLRLSFDQESFIRKRLSLLKVRMLSSFLLRPTCICY